MKFKKIKEILELADDELVKNNKETFVTLDYEDLLELKELYNELERQINTRIANEEFIEKNFISKDEIKEKLKIRKEEKAKSTDSNEAKLILREIYVLEELLEERKIQWIK